MNKYKFDLETLLKLQVNRRDQHRVALAEAYQAEQLLADRREDVQREFAELHQLRAAATVGPRLDVNRLLEAQRYELVLRAHDQQLADKQALLAVERERRRQVLIEADRDVKALQRLDERRRKQHRRRLQRLETKELDEVAAARYRQLSGSDLTQFQYL